MWSRAEGGVFVVFAPAAVAVSAGDVVSGRIPHPVSAAVAGAVAASGAVAAGGVWQAQAAGFVAAAAVVVLLAAFLRVPASARKLRASYAAAGVFAAVGVWLGWFSVSAAATGALTAAGVVWRRRRRPAGSLGGGDPLFFGVCAAAVSDVWAVSPVFLVAVAAFGAVGLLTAAAGRSADRRGVRAAPVFTAAVSAAVLAGVVAPAVLAG